MFTLNNTVSYQYFTFQNYQLVNNFRDGFANNFYFKHVLSRNGIRSGSPIFPTGGTILTFTLQWTPPYSKLFPRDLANESNQEKYKFIEYHKWKFDGAYYLGIGKAKKFVLLAACNFGFIGLYNQQLGLSPFERFFVGGDGLQGYSIDGRELIRLRGYSNYQAVTPTIADGLLDPPGATIYDKYTFELRYPFTTSQAATIYGLAFVEGGNAFLRFKEYDPFNIKRSAGVGIRLFLPMFGLLGFDWGYGFDSALPGGHSAGNFHLYIGQSGF